MNALPRMRIRRGRVMHLVKPAKVKGAKNGQGYRSECERVRGPISAWKSARYAYPDCAYCPPTRL